MLAKMGEKMDDVVSAANAAAGVAGAKAVIGKSAAFAMIAAAGFAGIIAMLVFEPQSRRDKALCLLSTFSFAALLPSVVKLYFGFELPDSSDGDLALAALTIACGAPGYLLMGAIIVTARKMKGKDIGEIISMVRGWF